jgi:hypothetical protein
MYEPAGRPVSVLETCRRGAIGIAVCEVVDGRKKSRYCDSSGTRLKRMKICKHRTCKGCFNANVIAHACCLAVSIFGRHCRHKTNVKTELLSQSLRMWLLQTTSRWVAQRKACRNKAAITQVAIHKASYRRQFEMVMSESYRHAICSLDMKLVQT